MSTTYSNEFKLFRATETLPRQQLLDIKEAVEGLDESSFFIKIAPTVTATIPLGGITAGRLLVINAKPKGGVTDVKMCARLTNITSDTSGVDTGAQDIRFGSYLMIMDGSFSALTVTNLDTLSAVDVQIFMLGV